VLRWEQLTIGLISAAIELWISSYQKIIQV
jgi:hypothetical protein